MKTDFEKKQKKFQAYRQKYDRQQLRTIKLIAEAVKLIISNNNKRFDNKDIKDLKEKAFRTPRGIENLSNNVTQKPIGRYLKNLSDEQIIEITDAIQKSKSSLLDNRGLVIKTKEFYRDIEYSGLVGDASKAKEVLGWEPAHTFLEMIKMFGTLSNGHKHDILQIIYTILA